MRSSGLLCLLLSLLVSRFLLGCAEDPAPKVAQASAGVVMSPLPRGVVHTAVPVAVRSTETYAAYVPKGTAVNLPLLLVFDSHGKGKMVAEKYQSLADELNVILAVSNTSKNGLEPKAAIEIGKRMLDAVIDRTPANSKCVYAVGFSGGARVAVNFLLAYPQVNGVIGCGAGYVPEQTGNADVDFFGIAGIEDFNFNEMMAVDSALKAGHKQGFILATEGGHAWPEPAVMKKAVQWELMESMRDGNLPVDTSMVGAFRREQLNLIVHDKRSDNLNIVSDCRMGISAFAGLADTTSFSGNLEFWQANAATRSMMAGREAAMKREMKERQALSGGLAVWDTEKWKQQISGLQARTGPSAEEQAATKRVLNFLSLMFYMQGNGAINQRNLESAEHFLTLYALVDPTNSETAYLNAQYQVLRNRPEQALDALAKAIDLGFEDSERLAGDQILVVLKTQPRYAQIAGRIPAE